MQLNGELNENRDTGCLLGAATFALRTINPHSHSQRLNQITVCTTSQSLYGMLYIFIWQFVWHHTHNGFSSSALTQTIRVTSIWSNQRCNLQLQWTWTGAEHTHTKGSERRIYKPLGRWLNSFQLIRWEASERMDWPSEGEGDRVHLPLLCLSKWPSHCKLLKHILTCFFASN